jgi:hypothetical protein
MALPKSVGTSATRWTRESRFVFTGAVERDASSSLSFVPPGPATAVVRVERIHYATEALQKQAGQLVTLLFGEGSVPEGEHRRLVFFTNPVLYGETVGVREIGHMDAPDDLDAVHELVVRVKREGRMEETRRHLASADAVVHGQVTSVYSASDKSVVPSSEHDPIWWVAKIRITRSLKGDLKDESAARYPNSRDIAWYRVPKLIEGQEGVFILHRDGLDLGGARLAILHPEDVLLGGADEVSRIHGLIR